MGTIAMHHDTIILSFGIVLLLSTGIAWINRQGKGTIQDFFWGNSNISNGLATNLVITNSFSLNGLLYQAWLGFSIGWWSLGIQAIWCLSFIILGLNASRFDSLLSRGTMHGVIQSRFGVSAGRIAAVASIIGFAVLIGWEAVVGATLLKFETGVSDVVYVVLPLVLVFIAAFYSSAGGLRGNAIVNSFQNILKTSVLVVAVFFVYRSTTDKFTTLFTSNASHISLQAAFVSLGGVALAANLAFSLFWQIVDMSMWQNLSSTRPDQRRSVVFSSALWVFVLPGVIGSLIGIGLSGLPNIAPAVSDSNILNQFAAALSGSPTLIAFLFAAFSASMLSTIDGYSLAAAQASTWDIIFPKTVKRLLSLGADRPADPDDARVLSVGQIILLVVALAGAAGIMGLVFAGGVSLFDLVYVVVIAQMSLVGPVMLCLLKPTGRIIRWGWIPILAALIVGFLCIAGRFNGRADLFTWAPVATIVTSAILTTILYAVTGLLAQYTKTGLTGATS